MHYMRMEKGLGTRLGHWRRKMFWLGGATFFLTTKMWFPWGTMPTIPSTILQWSSLCKQWVKLGGQCPPNLKLGGGGGGGSPPRFLRLCRPKCFNAHVQESYEVVLETAAGQVAESTTSWLECIELKPDTDPAYIVLSHDLLPREYLNNVERVHSQNIWMMSAIHESTNPHKPNTLFMHRPCSKQYNMGVHANVL